MVEEKVYLTQAGLEKLKEEYVQLTGIRRKEVAEKLQKDKIMWFESAAAAHNALGKILKPGDVILFQNDWPDNYL